MSTNRRNRYGFKDAHDCYRTINGHKYIAWMSCPSAERIATYRASNVRCRRFGDELFVHVFDTEEAKKVDQSVDKSAPKAERPNAGDEGGAET